MNDTNTVSTQATRFADAPPKSNKYWCLCHCPRCGEGFSNRDTFNAHDQSACPDNRIPAEVYHGFEIVASYISGNTGRQCKTIQCYRLHSPAGKRNPRGEYKGVYCSSKKDARKLVDEWRHQALDADGLENLAKHSDDYIKWIGTVFPESTNVETALKERYLRDQQRELESKKRELEPVWQQVANPDDWKAPVDAFCHVDDMDEVRQAIEFFTATDATFEDTQHKNWKRVKSIGYRRGPAGDH